MSDSKLPQYDTFITQSAKLKSLLSSSSHPNPNKVYSILLQLSSLHLSTSSELLNSSTIVDSHKQKLETLTNYNEGLHFQKSNIIRQIENCLSTPVDNIQQVPLISSKVAKLDSLSSKDALDEIDHIIGQELQDELGKRTAKMQEMKLIKDEIESVSKEVKDCKKGIRDILKYATEIEENMRKGYEKYSGMKIVSRTETKKLREMPKVLYDIFNVFYMLEQMDDEKHCKNFEISIEGISFAPLTLRIRKGI